MPKQDQNISNKEIYDNLNELRRELVARDDLLEQKVDRTYLKIQVFESEIDPLRRVVYGVVAIAGACLVTALMALVLKGQ
ncbi:hypothetical protein KDA11_02825 [Candidatus Saccharibacteria bacterium]|nr:hypothetical protein [Candidatus Saccharibacteria bacterium]